MVDVFPSRAPTGALRPPVAVGAPVNDDADLGFGGGGALGSFGTGRGSFPSFPSQQGSSGGGGWSFPPSQLNAGGGWNAEPTYAASYEGVAGYAYGGANLGGAYGGAAAGCGWGAVAAGHSEAADYYGYTASRPGNTIAQAGGWGGCAAGYDVAEDYSEDYPEERPRALAARSLGVPGAVASIAAPSIVPSAPSRSYSARSVPLPPDANMGVQPLMLAEQWAATYSGPPVSKTPYMAYPGGANVNFAEFAPSFSHVAAANAPHVPRIVPSIENGDVVRQTLRLYIACDHDLSGRLSWQNGEVQDFLTHVFDQYGLSSPSEQQMYELYRKFDSDRNTVLYARECLCLVDALFRAIFYLADTTRAPRMVLSAPSTPGIYQVSPSPLAFAGYPRLQVGGSPAAFFLPSRPSMAYSAAPSAAPSTIAASRAPSQHVLQRRGVEEIPRVVQAEILQGGLGGYYNGGPAAASSQRLLRGPQVGGPLPADRYRLAGGSQQRLRQRQVVGGPQLEEWPEEDWQSGVVQRHPAAAHDAWHPPVEGEDDYEVNVRSGPPPKPTPKPPKHQPEIEQRPHLLEIELNELELHPDAPDLAPKWFESLRFFISFHPRSETPENIPLPRDPPEKTEEGKLLVSTAQVAHLPKTKFASGWSLFAAAGGGDGESRTASSNPVADFKEQLALSLPQLDMHLVAYIWAKKSSMAGNEVTLIGRSLASMRDFSLQRRLTTWGVFDVMEGHRVAELRLKYAVSSTPAAIQKPLLADAKQTEVTVKWSHPQSDHGAPTEAYRVSILFNSKGTSEPQWYTLCARTKTTNPFYVVTNLTGNTSYMMDIRAINKAGVGDPCEFQITTAAIEPAPPTKPWIAEEREGCLNVVWNPSPSDGGALITAYKVKMRKIIGASKWNPFGPGEASSSWVDMGTVGAAMHGPPEPATYDAWVGPLEEQTCEYRFQIVAMNQVGVSKGSELSDPHYV